ELPTLEEPDFGMRSAEGRLDLPAPAGGRGSGNSLELPDFASGQSGSDFGDPGALDLDLPEPAAQQGGSHGGANLSFDLPAPRGQSTRFGTAAAADHGALEIPANTPDLEALDLPVPAENLPIPAEN